MTRDTMIADIRAACIKANSLITYKVGACGLTMPASTRGYCPCGEFVGLLPEKERPIRLADVLLAMERSTKAFDHHRNDLIATTYNKEHRWNLRTDDLTQQSDETIAFIHSLICV